MAIGDDAQEEGMALVPVNGAVGSPGKVKQGPQEFNRTRDYIAQFYRAAKLYAEGLASAISWASISGKPSFIGAGSSAASARSAIGAADSTTQGQHGTFINNIANGLLNAAPWDRNITWTRRAAWLGNDGSITLGNTSSTRATKQNIRPADLARDALRAIPVVLYRYKAEVRKERRRGDYRAATEIGTLADDLHALGLWQFVIYEGRGEDAVPVSVHYELLGLAGIALAQILADDYDRLEQRVSALEDAR